jgi:hypothetical protein
MRRGFVTAAVTVVSSAVCPAVAFADTTVDFDGFAAGTTITDQYANAGGAGNGVVFGPLPGGLAGFNPVVRTAPAGQAQSGANVADIVTCPSGTTDCEFVTPRTTGTFAVPRSHVSVDVGYLGSGSACVVPSDNGCAVVTLVAYDAGGTEIAASPTTLVKQGAGVHTPLSVTTSSPRIVGFQVTARTGSSDYDKQVAIDDLTFDTPTTPPTPDFTLTPQSTFVNVVQGSSTTDGITIGRIGGSSGNVALAVSGTLPTGVQDQIAPNPVPGSSSTLTLTADPTAPPTLGAPRAITVTGTPAAAGVGSAPRSFNVTVGVKQAFDVHVVGSTNIDLTPCDVSVPVEVTRDLAYPGPVSLSVTGLPTGVQGSFSPAQATFPNGAGAQTVTLNLTTPPDQSLRRDPPGSRQRVQVGERGDASAADNRAVRGDHRHR